MQKRTLLWNVRMSKSELCQLARLSEREGRSASEVVRELIAQAEQTTKRAPAPQQDGALPVSGP